MRKNGFKKIVGVFAAVLTLSVLSAAPCKAEPLTPEQLVQQAFAIYVQNGLTPDYALQRVQEKLTVILSNPDSIPVIVQEDLAAIGSAPAAITPEQIVQQAFALYIQAGLDANTAFQRVQAKLPDLLAQPQATAGIVQADLQEQKSAPTASLTPEQAVQQAFALYVQNGLDADTAFQRVQAKLPEILAQMQKIGEIVQADIAALRGAQAPAAAAPATSNTAGLQPQDFVSLPNDSSAAPVQSAAAAAAQNAAVSTPEPVKTETAVTTGMKNALDRAKRYLSHSSFSYTSLIGQLEYEGYTHEESVYAVDNCGADWNEQARKKAASYLNFTSFSYDGLIDQLEFEGFTLDQSRNAVENCGANWYEQAAKKAQSYMSHSSFSRSGLIDQLEFEGFSREQAEYAVTTVGY